MHQPPAASYSVIRSRWYFFCIVLIWLIACFACVGLWLSAANRVAKIGAFVCLGVFGAWAAKEWLSTEQGLLRWDGQQWLWDGFGDTPVQQLSLVLDFQILMLLKLRANHNDVCWLWLEAPTKRPKDRQWLAVRRAIVGAVGQP